MSKFDTGRFLEQYSRQALTLIFAPVFQFLNKLDDGFYFGLPETSPITSDYTVPIGEDWAPVDATSGNVTVTLPSALEAKGKRFTVKKIDSSANTVTITATQTIDDGASAVINVQYESICIMSDGAEYWIV